MDEPLTVDLNCDLGESFGRYSLGDDAAMMKLVTSVNIACGFHAGDPTVMSQTVHLAKQHGLAVGAHPGFADLQGFGRRVMGLSLVEISHLVCYQIGALDAFVGSAGMQLQHVKPHGALYNLAAADLSIAKVIAQSVHDFNSGLILVGLAGSALIEAGQAVGLEVAAEGFPDRVYLPDGQLKPRSLPDAVFTDPVAVAENALHLVKEGLVVDGIKCRIDTLCLHGDHPHAVRSAQTVCQKLVQAGISIRAMTADLLVHSDADKTS